MSEQSEERQRCSDLVQGFIEISIGHNAKTKDANFPRILKNVILPLLNALKEDIENGRKPRKPQKSDFDLDEISKAQEIMKELSNDA